MLDASSIPLTMSGGVPHVDVTLNGNVAQRMVLDSGAGLITLTSELADKLGMKPGKDDPKVTLVVADGRRTQAALMKIKSVRVGQFSVADVECAVLPAEVKGDNNLLGGTFLEHFVYRMDLAAQRLHLSQVGGTPATPDKAIAKGAAEKNPSGATPPTTTMPDVAPSPKPAASGVPAAPLAPTSRSSPAQATSRAASQPAVAAAGEGVELLDSMTGDTGRKEDGAIVLNDGERIQSWQKFKAPVSFRIVAQTNSNDLRIGAMADQIIFNWRDNPKELRIDGGPANGRHKPGAGQIPVNRWVEVQIDVTKNEMVIAVDGERRHRVQTSFARASRPLVIFPAVGSVIKVKSVRVVEQ
jgi:clan AA aspartic protease (TIGR02281 family)